MAAIGKAHLAIAPRAFLCCRAHSLAHDRGLGGIVQLTGDGGDQLVDMGMTGQRLVVRLPDFGKPLIPQVQTAVRCEHGNAFEQIVERGGAHPQQGVPRAGEPGLLGPVLEDQQQPAIRCRLGDDAQMGAIGQQPVFLDRLGRAKPLLALGPPRAEVAHLRQALDIAHTVQHAREIGLFGQPAFLHGEHSPEGKIGKGRMMIGIELDDAGRHRIQQVALRRHKPAMSGAGVGQFLHFDRIARHARFAEGHVDHQHIAAIAVDRHGDLPFQSLALVRRFLRK